MNNELSKEEKKMFMDVLQILDKSKISKTFFRDGKLVNSENELNKWFFIKTGIFQNKYRDEIEQWQKEMEVKNDSK